MPQLFQVLRCYKCLVFQVHQTKKSNKFQCKMCGEKQSIKRHYGLGNGQECRLHVQKLNVMRGNLTEEKEVFTSQDSEVELECEETKIHSIQKLKTSTSKWSSFVHYEDIIDQDEDETTYSNNEQLLPENPKKRKRNSGTSQKLILLSQETSENKSKFEAPYECNENMNQIAPEKSKHKTTDKLSKDKCDGFSNTKQNIVQGPLKEKSKWAQFLEQQEELESSEKCCTKSNSSSCNTNNIFELCNDTDLDVILNI